MSNKRDLKRTINYICGDLFTEGIAASLYGENRDNDNTEAILTAILVMHSNYIRRVSHVQPGMPAKVYFKDLKDKFSKEVNEIVDQLNNLA
ncbi:hypothetical protein J4856_01925 [Prevotella scopos JCM 17725]|uniref:RteC protein n=1 Tax=Prevotella scopos JCM 17725 TaxID=1236518 RepID=A0AAX2F675_9BACT|nr:hypothetical protein [Prevotella scopos]ANR74158.1 hypothetical protein AXF22_12185 [Prevotella scopos JCM 17725]QUB44750.1 hypothetical protein J4856_01925 [Prevotella scopos JCM 17725]SHG05784.1 hypothetical protein SAMN05444364_1315 [Prevotella scopos JCM 17725]